MLSKYRKAHQWNDFRFFVKQYQNTQSCFESEHIIPCLHTLWKGLTSTAFNVFILQYFIVVIVSTLSNLIVTKIKPFKFRAQLIYKCLLHRSVYGITILKETKIVKVHCNIDLNYLTEHQAQCFYVYDCCITFPYCLCFLQQMIT